MKIFREIPFVKPQNNTQSLTTDKQLKMMEKEREKTYLVFVDFLLLVQCLEDCSTVGMTLMCNKDCLIVGMTVTCNRCDVMNIMWCKTEVEQKSDRERWRYGGGGGGGSAELWNTDLWEEKRKKNWIRPWKRKKASKFKHPKGWMGKLEYPGK